MRKVLLTLVIAAAAAVGCTSQPVVDSVVRELPAGSFKQQWSRDLKLKNEEIREMYVRGESLFAYTTRNTLYRINRATGDIVFVSNPVGPEVGVKPPLVLRDGIVVPADTKLYFLDRRGFVEKKIDLRSAVRTEVVGDERHLFIGVAGVNGSGRVVDVNPSRPYSPFNWELMTGGVSANPVVAQAALYIGADNGLVYAVNPDRSATWPLKEGTFATQGRIVANLVADKSCVYVASTDTKLYAIGLKDGKLRWQFLSGSALMETPAVTDTAVYVRTPEDGVICIDKKEGKYSREPKWKLAQGRSFLAEDATYAYIRARSNQILAVDKETGEVKFQSARKDLEVCAVNPVDNVIYAATRDGEVLGAVSVTKAGTVGAIVWMEQNNPVMVAAR